MKNCTGNMNVLFDEKRLSNTYQYFRSSGKISFGLENFHKIWKSFQTIGVYSYMKKTVFKYILYYKKCGKITFLLEKFPENLVKFWDILELFQTIWIYSVMKNSFQRHVNTLDSLKKFYLLWNSLQKTWKSFRTVWIIFSNTRLYWR